MPPTQLEVAEAVGKMRMLEHGMSVRRAPTRHNTQSVDTPADLRRVEALMRAQ